MASHIPIVAEKREQVFYSLPYELKLHTLWIHTAITPCLVRSWLTPAERGTGQSEREREEEWCCWVGSVENEKEERKKKDNFTYSTS